MKKIIFLFTLFTLILKNPCNDIHAQNLNQDSSYTNEDNSGEIISIYDDDKKFKFLGSFQAGISVSNYAGFDLQLSAYHLFNRTVGIGAEFQYNNFPESEDKIFNIFGGGYYTIRHSGFILYTLKLNMLVGNLHPENSTVYYGLFGAGYQYYSRSESLDFLYGAGGGVFYKIDKEIGIGGEIQYNISNGYYASDGILSLTFGITYTVL